MTVEPGGSAAKQTLLNFAPSKHRPSDTPQGRLPRVLKQSGDRLTSDQPQPDTAYMIFSPGAKYPAVTKNLVSPALQYAIDLSGGNPTTVYLVRLNQAGPTGPIVADAGSYAKARASVIRYWDDRLRRGARFEVPERLVMEAQRALLIQNLNMGKWYSVGNFYQTSYTQQYNALKTLGEYGFPARERKLNEELMGFTQGGRKGFDTLLMGIKMWAAADYYRRTRDQEFIDKITGSVEGSYWNLVITHPLGVGVIQPRSARAQGVLRYDGRAKSFQSPDRVVRDAAMRDVRSQVLATAPP